MPFVANQKRKTCGDLQFRKIQACRFSQGFGEALLDFALAELKETECAGIYLLVFKENYSGRHFYEKYGFIFTEEFSSCTLDETAVPEIKYVYKKQGRD